jgi:hypothetical protein
MTFLLDKYFIADGGVGEANDYIKRQDIQNLRKFLLAWFTLYTTGYQL